LFDNWPDTWTIRPRHVVIATILSLFAGPMMWLAIPLLAGVVWLAEAVGSVMWGVAYETWTGKKVL